MVFDFLKNLGRQKANAAKASVKAKGMSARARAQMKVAAKVNQGADAAKKKATQRKAAPQDEAEAKDEKMGLFGKKKGAASPAAPPPEQEANFGEKTQFIQAIDEDEFRPVVGWLVALNGALKGHDFRLRDGKNMIGTAADVEVVLTDQYMSSRHAVIRHEDGIFVIVDLDSTNGTYVNEQRVSKEELIDNDRLRFGRTDLKFKSLY